MDNNYCAPLAAILRKAQGCVDPDTDELIDVGGEVSKLRRICDSQRDTISRLKKELREIDIAIADPESNLTKTQAECVQKMHKTISRLREYARHKEDCMARWPQSKDPTCDCGYDELIKEIGE